MTLLRKRRSVSSFCRDALLAGTLAAAVAVVMAADAVDEARSAVLSACCGVLC
jgi:hypothetical protein